MPSLLERKLQYSLESTRVEPWGIVEDLVQRNGILTIVLTTCSGRGGNMLIRDSVSW